MENLQEKQLRLLTDLGSIAEPDLEEAIKLYDLGFVKAAVGLPNKENKDYGIITNIYFKKLTPQGSEHIKTLKEQIKISKQPRWLKIIKYILSKIIPPTERWDNGPAGKLLFALFIAIVVYFIKEAL